MSMTHCEKCDRIVDTDINPEYYREEFNDACICEDCYVEFEDFADEEESEDE